MNIRKWYNNLPTNKQYEIESIVHINHAQGWAAINGYTSICYVLFTPDPNYIWWITDRMQAIARLIYWYVSHKLWHSKR